MATLTETQLDALRELANIGSGNAGTALSGMLGRSVDISVPTAAALPLQEAVELVGDPEDLRHGVMVPVFGDLDAVVLLLFPEDDAQKLCAIYGLDASSPDGASMLAEVGNILGANYINALGQMAGMEMEPAPPEVVTDMLGAMVTSVLLATSGDVDQALMLDSELIIEDENCSLSFLLLPTEGGVEELLGRLGVV